MFRFVDRQTVHRYRLVGNQQPGCTFRATAGRLAILQNSKAIAQQFTGEKGFGEKQFQPFLQELLDPQSRTAAAVAASKQGIKADVDSFATQAKELVSSTAQIANAVLASEGQAILDAAKQLKTDTGTLGTIRTLTSETMKQTTVGGFRGFFDNLGDYSTKLGSNASEASLEALTYLLDRRKTLQSDGLQGDDATNVATINQVIEKIYAFIEADIEAGSIDKASASQVSQRARRLSRPPDNAFAQARGVSRDYDPDFRTEFARLAAILERVAASNEKMVAPAQATAANTGRTPAVTPALSADQP